MSLQGGSSDDCDLDLAESENIFAVMLCTLVSFLLGLGFELYFEEPDWASSML